MDFQAYIQEYLTKEVRKVLYHHFIERLHQGFQNQIRYHVKRWTTKFVRRTLLGLEYP